MRISHKIALPIAVLTLTACPASQSDIRVLQSDLGLIRAEAAQADSARRAQLDKVIASLRVMNDSLASVNGRLMRLTADTRNGITELGQQLVQIQELTGQSQRRLQEVRASLEARTAESSTTVEPGASGNPGPNQLFQLAREQLLRGSNSAARTAFQDLITKYPKSDVASDAQFYIAESFAAEGNQQSADSAYAEVVKRYPKSSRSATALYKRATYFASVGNPDRAMALYNEIIKKYPRSDEATLAKDRIKALDQ